MKTPDRRSHPDPTLAGGFHGHLRVSIQVGQLPARVSQTAIDHLFTAKQFFELVVQCFVDLILQLFLQLLTSNGLQESGCVRLWCRDGASQRDRNGASAGSLFFQRYVQGQLQLLIESHCAAGKKSIAGQFDGKVFVTDPAAFQPHGDGLLGQYQRGRPRANCLQHGF